MKNKILKTAVAILTATALLIGAYITYTETGKIDTDKISEAVETVVNEINTYEMSEEDLITYNIDNTNNRELTVMKNNIDMVRLLLDSGADANILDNKGRNAKHFASFVIYIYKKAIFLYKMTLYIYRKGIL